jgi:hypothetical protein
MSAFAKPTKSLKTAESIAYGSMVGEDHFPEIDSRPRSRRRPSKPPVPLDSLVFITTTDTSYNGRPSSEARKIARKHVITSYHVQKHSMNSRQMPWSSRSVDSPGFCHTGRFRLEGHDRHRKEHSIQNDTKRRVEGEIQEYTLDCPEICNIRSQNFIDPFGATALRLDRGRQEFIQHCTTPISNHLDRGLICVI